MSATAKAASPADEVQEEEKPEEENVPPPDVVVELSCTIYEFYNGSIKSFQYFRDELQPDGRTV